MRYSKAWRQSVLWLGIWLLAHQALAINVQIDYTYDTSNFFGSGNPQGAVAGSQARAALEAAASFYSTMLTNEFDAITVPAPYHSSVPGSAGVVIWNWQAQFPNPSDSSGTQVVIPNPTVNADQYIVYAGRALTRTIRSARVRQEPFLRQNSRWETVSQRPTSKISTR